MSAVADGEARDVAPDSTSWRVTPQIGAGWRWYDLLYRALRWLQYSRVRRWLPVRWHARIELATSFLYQTHHAAQARLGRGGRSWNRLELPAGEAVSIPGIWVTEYFTASQVSRLYDAIRRAGWNDARFIGNGPRAAESLSSSRSGDGGVWWQIANLIPKEATTSVRFETQRAALPHGITGIDLIGVPIGKGITAVVAGFTLDPSFAATMTSQLHREHRPAVLRRKGQWAVSQPAQFVLYYRTQTARSDMHRQLRAWMSKTLPGSFAATGRDHPVFDLMFFDVADPFAADAEHGRHNDALRAAGINDWTIFYTTSDTLPGLLLESPGREDRTPDLTENVWTLWGNRNAIPGLTEHSGSTSERTAVDRVGSFSTDFFARAGLTALLTLMRAEASVAHDNARRLHGGAGRKDLKRLRERLLTTSLDLTTIEEDVRAYNDRRWRVREPEFRIDYAPWLTELHVEQGRPAFKPISVNKQHRKEQRRLARELVAFDTEYREILSTVASLNASLDSRRTQRVAGWIAVASLVVALVTLWATSAQWPALITQLRTVMESAIPW